MKIRRVIAVLLCLLIFSFTFTVYASNECNHVFVWKYPEGSYCDQAGRIMIYICEKCGEIADTFEIETTEHVLKDVVLVPNSIDSVGYHIIKCENCDYYEDAGEIGLLEATDNFNDVPDDAWYKHAVSYAYAEQFFSGVGGNRFAPEGEMTRAMFVTVAGNLCSEERDRFKNSDFTDVPSGTWYTSSVAWAADREIVTGIGNNLFAPDYNISREQAACILYRLASYLEIPCDYDESVLEKFIDNEKISSWAKSGVAFAVSNGIMNGKGDGILDPLGVSTRSQNAQLFYAFFEKLYIPSQSREFNVTKADYIASYRQMMMEGSILDFENTTATITLNTPEKKELAFTFNASYETTDAVYHSIVRLEDGSYRMYYKATADKRRICYIESEDGLKWTRPKLTTLSLSGKRTNCVTNDSVSPDNLYVFYDTNPACPENRRWKGVYGQWGDGLFLEFSDDGNLFPFWTPSGDYEIKIMGTPSETGGCYFDSLNTIHWDEARGKYVAFVRGFHYGDDYNLSKEFVTGYPTYVIRDIRYSESDDCIHWTKPVPLTYSDGNDYQMYANAIMPYGRDTESLYIGLPTRYNGQGSSAFTDNMFMFSSDLVNWERFDTRYMLPGSSNLIYGDCFPAVGMVETETDYGTAYSIYMKEKKSAEAKSTELYRYEIRADGFVGLYGEDAVVRTKTMTYLGSRLSVNYKCDDGGYIILKLTDKKGNEYIETLTGDYTDFETALDGIVAKLQFEAVTLEFELHGAQLYSFRFA